MSEAASQTVERRLSFDSVDIKDELQHCATAEEWLELSATSDQKRNFKIVAHDVKHGARVTHLSFPIGTGASNFLRVLLAESIRTAHVGRLIAFVGDYREEVIDAVLNAFGISRHGALCTNRQGVTSSVEFFVSNAVQSARFDDKDSLVIVDDNDLVKYDASLTKGRVILCHVDLPAHRPVLTTE